MPDTVPVVFELDSKTAAALKDAETHAKVTQVIHRTVHQENVEHLIAIMKKIAREAKQRGLTQKILDAELEAYNAERRDRPADH